jgi:hypothetical protein
MMLNEFQIEFPIKPVLNVQYIFSILSQEPVSSVNFEKTVSKLNLNCKEHNDFNVV